LKGKENISVRLQIFLSPFYRNLFTACGQDRLQAVGELAGMLDAAEDEGADRVAAAHAQGAELLSEGSQLKTVDLRQQQGGDAASAETSVDQKPPVGEGVEDLLPFQAGLKMVTEGQVESREDEGDRDPGEEGGVIDGTELKTDRQPEDREQQQQNPEKGMPPVTKNIAAGCGAALPEHGFTRCELR
jgi:hypothetical protein